MPGNDAVSIVDMTQRAYDCIRLDDLAEKTYEGYWYSGIIPIRKYCENHGIKTYSIEAISECVRWFREQYEHGLVYPLKFQHVRKIAMIMEQLANGQSYQRWTLTTWKTAVLAEPFRAYLADYLEHKRQIGYSDATIRNNGAVIKHFLMYTETLGYVNIQQLTQADAVNYISTLSKDYKSVGDALSILRQFGTWLHSEGYTKLHLDAIFSVKVPARKKLHEGFTIEEAERIINGIDRSTVCGKRDYAILMLAMHTGLRGVDVMTLTFDSIDWKHRAIHLVQSKTSKFLTLPVPTNVLNAIADYILNARPESREKSIIFLRTRRPYMPMRAWTAYKIVQRNAVKVGVEWAANERKGFHSFRRSIASWMLEAEIPLETITEILGHRNTDSAKPYIITHRAGLQECALDLQMIPLRREELQ